MMKNREAIKEYLKKIATNLIKENVDGSIQDELDSLNRTNGYGVDNEIGRFSIVLHPQENSIAEELLMETDLFEFVKKLSSGELKMEQVAGFYKKSTTAQRKSDKIIKEYSKTLLETRKTQIKEYQRRKEYLENRIKATNKFYKNQPLDETVKNRVSKMQEGISFIDGKINEITKKIEASKSK